MNADQITGVVEKLRGHVEIPSFRVGNEQVRMSCPFALWAPEHKASVDRNPGFSIHINPSGSSAFYCFTCRRKGRSIEYLVSLIDKLVAGADLSKLRISVGEAEFRNWAESDVLEVGGEKPLRLLRESVLEPYRSSIPRYALQRGLTLETCRIWGLGYDRRRKRLLIPVREAGGRLVGASGRTLIEGVKPKYHDKYFGVGLPKDLVLFGENMLEGGALNPIILVEGEIDVMAVRQAGARNPLGIMGTKLSDIHVEKIKTWANVVILFLDDDPAGRKARASIRKRLRGRVQLYDAYPPRWRDPGSCTGEQILRCLDEKIYSL